MGAVFQVKQEIPVQMTLRVILADPPNIKGNPYMLNCPNLGLLYLASSLRRELPGCEITYIGAHNSMEQHLSIVERIRPAIYGLSFTSTFASRSLYLIDRVKRANPDTLVVCGGAYPTVDACGVLNHSKADICCIGEGEITFVDIVRTLLAGVDWSTVPGIAYKNADRTIMFNRRRSLESDLDSISFPAWNLVDFRIYQDLRKRKKKLSTAIVASRGCQFDCVFCSSPVWKVQKPWLRKRSPDNIAEEVDLLYRMGIREIYIRSDAMNADVGWAIAVFDALGDLQHRDLFFQCNLRGVPITAELACSMRRAQCWICCIGVESGSERVLNGVRKRVSLPQLESGLEILREHHIAVYAFMMMYQAWESEWGLEFESTGEVLRSLAYVLRLRLRGMVRHMSWGFAVPYRGSELARVAEKYFLLDRVNREHNPTTPNDIALSLPGVSYFEMRVAQALGLLLQGLFVVTSTDSYRKMTIVQNLKHAAMKASHLLGWENG